MKAMRADQVEWSRNQKRRSGFVIIDDLADEAWQMRALRADQVAWSKNQKHRSGFVIIDEPADGARPRVQSRHVLCKRARARLKRLLASGLTGLSVVQIIGPAWTRTELT